MCQRQLAHSDKWGILSQVVMVVAKQERVGFTSFGLPSSMRTDRQRLKYHGSQDTWALKETTGLTK